MSAPTTEPRSFDLGDVLTITTGTLVSLRGLDGAYDILNFLTGDNLFTHQLPRAMRDAAPALLAQHPDLSDVVVPDWSDVPDERMREVVNGWLDMLGAVYGDTLSVAPLEHFHHVDPVQELVEMTERPDRVVVVAPGGLCEHHYRKGER